MDLQALVAAHLTDRGPRRPMDAQAEERYFRTPGGLPSVTLRRLAAAGTTAGAILLALGIADT